MVDSNLERKLQEDEIKEMIRLVDPEWDLRDSTFIEDGISAIYRVSVETTAGVQEYYLKATPVLDGSEIQPRVDTEARLTEWVRHHTDIPVPIVIGAVDDHDAVRTPFFLMEAMPGQKNEMDVLFDISVESMAALARETGRYMGQLHNVETPNLDRFGKGITFDIEYSLQGEQPRGNSAELTFPDGYSSWPKQMQEWVGDDIDALAESDRFEDLVGPIERCLTGLIKRLPTSAMPTVGRVDHGLWNILTDETCSRSTAWLDWGSLFSVPPAFDLAIVEYHLGGGAWMGLEEVAEYRRPLRSALLEGYRLERALPEVYDLQRRCYLLDTVTLALSTLDESGRRQRHLPEERVDEAAKGLRGLTQALLSAE